MQRRLKNSNHSLTSVVIRIHALMEAPALSYLQTLKTSSTAHVLWDITADFVKNEEQYLAKSSCRKTEGAGQESINCLSQRLYPFMRSSAMRFLKKGFGAIKTNLQTNHFKRAIREIRALLEGDIGGYPIPQYRKKKWQIPKYRVENRLNTDTVYFNHIYNRLRILMVASI